MVCPICIASVLYQLPEAFPITAAFRGQQEDVRAFVCTQGHVFLCRCCDVDDSDPQLSQCPGSSAWSVDGTERQEASGSSAVPV